MNDFEPPPLSATEQALSYISSDTPRDNWIKVLMAVKSEHGEQGRDIAEQWSSTGDSFNQKDFNASWKSINGHGGITIKSLFDEAIRNGYAPEKPKSIDPVEVRKREKERKERAELLAKAEKLKREKAAQSCIDKWDKASSTINHSYLEKKRVKPYGLKQSGDQLLIPVRINKEITSLQTISSEGNKLFHPGGEIKGGFHVIGKPDDNPILISEGYATACLQCF